VPIAARAFRLPCGGVLRTASAANPARPLLGASAQAARSPRPRTRVTRAGLQRARSLMAALG